MVLSTYMPLSKYHKDISKAVDLGSIERHQKVEVTRLKGHMFSSILGYDVQGNLSFQASISQAHSCATLREAGSSQKTIHALKGKKWTPR